MKELKDIVIIICVTIAAIFFIKGYSENFAKEFEIRKSVGTGNK